LGALAIVSPCLIGMIACGAPNVAAPSADVPYVLLAPIRSTTTSLIDLDGQVVHQWQARNTPALSVYLLPNGHLLRTNALGAGSFPGTGGNGGLVTEYDWDGNLVWSFEYFSPTYQQHHDVRRMPNGHVLMLAFEMRSAAEAVAAGRDPSTIPANGQIWVDHVIEVDPATNQIVWVWRLWDHLLPPGADPADHPELVDPNAYATATTSDWTHANSIDYNASLDQILLSVRNHNEIWVIDHSTTTEEAAGHAGGIGARGGDLLYRWGSPLAYGLTGAQQLFAQHNAHWIEDGLAGAGEILVFDNGDRQRRPYSTVVQLAPPVQATGGYSFDATAGFGPAAPSWRYVASPPESLFASFISGAQRLQNGNTLVCDGPAGRILEVTTGGETVWSYLLTSTTGGTGVQVFRATRYEASFEGLRGRALSPQGPLRVELSP
jgi:hypothetical protein